MGFAGRLLYFNASFLRGALSQELCDVEVYKIGVMKNN